MGELLADGEVVAFRRLFGLDEDGDGAIVDLAAIERFDARLDRRAGTHRLSDVERAAVRACRERFGHYDPTNTYQICFLAERDTPPAVAEPEPVVWDRYLRQWRAA